jgi:hypothetical protein
MRYDMLEREEERRRVSTDIAIAAKALRVCEFHGIAFAGDSFGEAERLSMACQIANSMWSAGKIESGLFDSRRDLTDSIKAAIDDHPAEGCTFADCPNG